MIELNITPRFKYSTIHCSRFRSILIIYRRTTSGSGRKNYYHVQGWHPVSILFRNLNTTVHGSLDLTLKLKIAHSYVTKNIDIFIIYRATKARSVHKNDQHVLGWNPTTIFFQKLNTMLYERVAAYTTLQI